VTFCANFSRLSKSLGIVKQNRNLLSIALTCLTLNSAQRSKIKITGRPRQSGAEHSAPEFLSSTAVAWVWNPVRPYFQAVNRDQTLGLRSVVPLASSSWTFLHPARATQSCRGAKLYFSYLLRVPCFSAVGNLGRTAFNNWTPNSSQIRLSAHLRNSKAETVENLCKPEEKHPLPAQPCLQNVTSCTAEIAVIKGVHRFR